MMTVFSAVSADERRWTHVLPLLFGIGLFAVFFLPFLGKAFHIDDSFFIDSAGLIGWNPLEASPADYPYKGVVIRHYLPYEASHPFLLPYMMKVVRAAFGESERAMHAAFLIFPFMALIALAKLTSLLFPAVNRKAFLVPLFLMAVPAFLVNAHNVMADVPTLALFLTSLAWYISAIEKERALHAFVGSIFLSAAIFSSYQMLALIPLVLIYAWKRQRLILLTLVSLAVPVLCMVSWVLMIYSRYGIFPLIKSSLSVTGLDNASEIARGYGPGMFSDRAVSILALLGTSLFFVFAVYAVCSAAWRRLAVMFGVGIVVMAVFFSLYASYPFFETTLLSVLVTTALISLSEAVRLTYRAGESSPQRFFLLAWALTVLGYNQFVLPFGSARYLLPAIPPLIMLLISAIDWGRAKRSTLPVAAAFLLSALFGLANAYADYFHAGTYREIAREVQQFRSEKYGSPDVWYIGEWGMRYYLDSVGARYLLNDLRAPRKGDYLVIPEMPRFWQPHMLLTPRLQLYATREFRSALPLKIFHRQSRAGFYAQHWGLLSFGFSQEPQERFEIWEVH
ncbi:MAG: glycosyltransferase family 39 protein [Nitrospirae bacterium]|nr:glycosyltransferase family 39 protein [Nitrospirota bacterium]